MKKSIKIPLPSTWGKSGTRLNMLTINPRAFGFEKDLRLSFQKYFLRILPPDGALANWCFSFKLK